MRKIYTTIIYPNHFLDLAKKFNKTFCLFTSAFLVGCSSIKQIGEIGPKKLKVYSISQSDFLTASRMIVVLDDKGNLGASSGGTVSGGGTVGLQTTASLAGAGAILYGAKAIQHGLEHSKIKGIPSNVNINSKIDIVGHLK